MSDGHPPCKKKKSTALDQLFGETYEVRTAARSSREKASEEILWYRERNLLPLNGNPPEWWRAQVDLPLLSDIAKIYLCIPATSVAAEIVFSTAGDIISSQRSVLRCDHADQLIFLKKNLKKLNQKWILSLEGLGGWSMVHVFMAVVGVKHNYFC